MALLKTLELRFRRLLMALLKTSFGSRHQIPSDVDFNKCKVLFLRQDLIGDALISTPVFDVLKRTYPGITLDVLMSPKNHFVLQNDSSVRKRWIYAKSPVQLWKLRKNVRSEKYDFVVDLLDNPSTTSTLWCLNAGARWRVGLAKENDFCYDCAAPLLEKADHHVVERTANVMTCFNIDPSKADLQIRYFVSAESSQFAEQFWQSARLEKETVVGVNISAGDVVRSWWRENCREFLKEVAHHRPDWKILLMFKPEDREKAKSLAEKVHQVLLPPATPTFDHLAALVKRLTFLVTPDTSIVQLASAFSIPSVVLHLKISALHGHLWEPFRSDAENLVASADNVDMIPWQQVYAAFKRLVARHNTKFAHKTS